MYNHQHPTFFIYCNIFKVYTWYNIYRYFILFYGQIPLYGGTTFCLFIHLLMNFGSFSPFWLLWIILWLFMYKFLCRYIFSSQVCTLGVGLLGRLVALCLIFWGTNKLCFKDAAPFYILISSGWGLQLLHLCQHFFFNCLFNYSHVNSCGVVLIYISLVTNDVDFTCVSQVLFNYIPSEKCLFRSFAHFRVGYLLIVEL